MFIPAGLLADLITALPMDDRIEIVDVGASNVSAKELPSYDALLTNNLARLTGFEPNPAELAKLTPTDTRRYLPYASARVPHCPSTSPKAPAFVPPCTPTPR
jgi:hypothetical protein